MIDKSIEVMLDQWESEIKHWIVSSKKKVEDPKERVKPINKERITVYDFSSYKKQKNTQKRLAAILPELKELIESLPTILDQEWPLDAYLELILNHYMIIIHKIKKQLCAK